MFGGVVTAAALGGGVVGPQRPATRRWFDSLDKPPAQPPDKVFGPVWSALYPMIGAAGWTVWREPDSADRRRSLGLWAAQMAANAAWSPAFFGLKRPRWALAILTVQLATTGAFVAQNIRRNRTAAVLMGPYLAWSGFAFGLNASIARRNRARQPR